MNRYLFQASSRLTSEDQLHVSLLYQPIMGSLASSLITLLYQRINHDHLRAHMKESELCELASCRPNELKQSHLNVSKRLDYCRFSSRYRIHCFN